MSFDTETEFRNKKKHFMSGLGLAGKNDNEYLEGEIEVSSNCTFAVELTTPLSGVPVESGGRAADEASIALALVSVTIGTAAVAQSVRDSRLSSIVAATRTPYLGDLLWKSS
ncbi:hypothetical protein B0T26DRAFT_673345 [Lasiosphaeria miniovina]|uniref:Uncharacterized protein n=1 Tax=Lasiosphaeria miniovina TaxID=1954250 RepID=A0AA40B728_9PEZI|nr:uncharacterized protein B0T26DRAFT_673345 [Lasiosphaeria miniovina]KAK0728879.1 hypothetical protein B0T26DRAFT_673345 [Lasiosphaeria miniovina]